MTDIIADKIVVTLEDRISGPAKAIVSATALIGTGLQHVSKGVSSTVKDWAISAAGAIGLSLGIGALARKVVDANKELGAIQKGIAQASFAFDSWNKSLSGVERMRIAMTEAKEATRELEEAETRLAMPLEDLGQIYRTVAGPAFGKLGMNRDQVIDLTNMTADLAKAYGVSGEQAAMAVTRSLEFGKVPARAMDPVSVKLREIIGHQKHLSAAQVYDRMKRGLGDVKGAAEELSNGLGGTMFRIRDLVEDTLRDVGLPVFKAIANTLKEWQQKITASAGGMQGFIDKVSGSLVKGFEVAKSLTTFLLDHWKEIAIVIGGIKVGGMLSGVAGGAASVATALSGGGTGIAASIAASVAPALGGLATAIGPVVVGLAALAAAAVWVADLIGSSHEKELRQASATQGLLLSGAKAFQLSALGDAQAASAHIKAAYSAFGIKPGAPLEREKIAAGLRAMPAAEAVARMREWGAPSGLRQENAELLIDEMAGKIARGLSGLAESYQKAFPKLFGIETPEPEKKGKTHPPVSPAPVNNFYGDIHITQDFKDQDPDRVYLSFKNDLERLPENQLGASAVPAY